MTSPADTHSNLALWPRQMRAETAARYCDEVSELAFMRAVRAGLYPAGVAVPGKGLRWLKEDLDATIEKIHGKARPAAGPRPMPAKARAAS